MYTCRNFRIGRAIVDKAGCRSSGLGGRRLGCWQGEEKWASVRCAFSGRGMRLCQWGKVGIPWLVNIGSPLWESKADVGEKRIQIHSGLT